MIDNFTALGLLIIAHVIADFYLQTAGSLKSKASRQFGIAAVAHVRHAASHTILTGIALYLAAGFQPYLVGVSLLVGASHLIIDFCKSYIPKCRGSLWCFCIDQLLHLAVLLSVWAYIFVDFSAVDAQAFRALIDLNLVTLVAAYLLILQPTSIVIRFILKPWSTLKGSENNQAESVEELDKAGSLIGILERIIILTLILIDQFTAIGFVLAAKSILRFKEEHKHEYVLLGTITSLAIVLVIGLGARFILS